MRWRVEKEKKIKKQIEDNDRLARRLRREERKSPSVSRRKSPSVSKNKSKSKSKSPNNNSASTVQTNSLKSNLRKIEEQQIQENEEMARKLQYEQSNHNS